MDNTDWRKCMLEYDHDEAVFYLDPPYIDAYAGTYKHENIDYRELIDIIFHMKGFVALSGYDNPLYDNQPWDSKHEWESFVSVQPLAMTEGNFKKEEHDIKRENAHECLWIKDNV